MSEAIRDSSVKLFGMTIVVPEQRQSSSATSVSSSDMQDKSGLLFKGTNHGDNSLDSDSTEETSAKAATSSGMEKDSLSSQTKSNEEEETSESGVYQEKTTLDKTDKILSCPRCISKDTKFCYYNNNNHNQPRHFCKNCQRYWTNGGVMRNLPIGSGRRKTKCVPIPNYPHDMTASSDVVNGIHLASLEQNRFRLYGSDESKASEHSRISAVFYPTTPYYLFYSRETYEGRHDSKSTKLGERKSDTENKCKEICVDS